MHIALFCVYLMKKSKIENTPFRNLNIFGCLKLFWNCCKIYGYKILTMQWFLILLKYLSTTLKGFYNEGYFCETLLPFYDTFNMPLSDIIKVLCLQYSINEQKLFIIAWVERQHIVRRTYAVLNGGSLIENVYKGKWSLNHYAVSIHM